MAKPTTATATPKKVAKAVETPTPSGSKATSIASSNSSVTNNGTTPVVPKELENEVKWPS